MRVLILTFRGRLFLFDGESGLLEVLAWHRTGNRPFLETMVTQLIKAYMRHQPSMFKVFGLPSVSITNVVSAL